jgi:hypothetical protein
MSPPMPSEHMMTRISIARLLTRTLAVLHYPLMIEARTPRRHATRAIG